VPVRTSRDDNYFSDTFQAMPAQGYTRLFERLLSHPRIQVRLNTDFRSVRAQACYRWLVYTGPIDAYFDFADGALPYRSLRFEHQTFPVEYWQPAVQVNYPGPEPYTRIVEVKHITGQRLPATTIVREYPQPYDARAGSDPYYPLPTPAARALYEKYARRAEREAAGSCVSFVGRLARYAYVNMDQVVAMALREFDRVRQIHPLRRVAA
jgi:UDP-galactopyranose mutase